MVFVLGTSFLFNIAIYCVSYQMMMCEVVIFRCINLFDALDALNPQDGGSGNGGSVGVGRA
ncbi:hypothetical protein, partial [Enterobacter intestinihominis]